MAIIDRRSTGKNKSVENRQKFLKRYKHRIKRSIDDLADAKGITDVLKDRSVTVDNGDITEPSFDFDMSTGERDMVFPGNKSLDRGDRIYSPPQSDEGSDGEGLDEFRFVLSKEEFLDLYFSDMQLPDFIKESLTGTTKTKWKRTGYSKDGIPPRLDLVKTLKQGLARRIANKNTIFVCPACNKELTHKSTQFRYFCPDCALHSNGIESGKPQRFLDDLDLRYKHFTKQPFPVRQATMICLMDVSGSMEEFEKGLAKKFFLLLYLFLHKVYNNVNVLFIRHTQEAAEVTEHEFFHSQETGGTIVSSGLKLVNEIIDDRIDLATTNVYVAQASDGDNWYGDDGISRDILESILTKVQYFAYVQTEDADRLRRKQERGVRDLMTLYADVAESHRNLQARHITDDADVYPVLRSLFEER